MVPSGLYVSFVLCNEGMHAIIILLCLVSLGTIRLVEGSYQWEGRVEIFLSGTWGTISSDQSIYEGAWVVCRQLGYTGGMLQDTLCK